MFGAFGLALKTSVTFVSQAALNNPAVAALGLKKPLIAVSGTRKLKKSDMVHNGATPEITVDSETYVVKADGVHLVCEPATELPLTPTLFPLLTMLIFNRRTDHPATDSVAPRL